MNISLSNHEVKADERSSKSTMSIVRNLIRVHIMNKHEFKMHGADN